MGSADTEFADAARAASPPGVDFHIGKNIILFGYHIHHFYIGIFLNILFFHDFWESVKQRITDSGSHSLFEHAVLKHNTFLKMADFISIKTGKSEKVSLIFTGFLYMGIAGIIFVHPKTVRYWVAIIFIVQGLDYLLYFTKIN